MRHRSIDTRCGYEYGCRTTSVTETGDCPGRAAESRENTPEIVFSATRIPPGSGPDSPRTIPDSQLVGGVCAVRRVGRAAGRERGAAPPGQVSATPPGRKENSQPRQPGRTLESEASWSPTGGGTCTPLGQVTRQVARGLIDAVDGFLQPARHLIVDRDPLFTADFRERLAAAGVKILRLPGRSPNLNAHAERFVGSIRRELLDRVIPLGAGHLRQLVAAYVRHYNSERPHQAKSNRLLEPTDAANTTGPILCRERAGGLLRFYYREAA